MRAITMVVALSLIAGCGGSGPGRLSVRGAVVGAAPVGSDAAVYFEVDTDAADAIVGAGSDVAGDVSLHELELMGGGGIMLPVDRFDLEPGTTTLQPMGSHVMLHELNRTLEPGDRVELRLEFDHHVPLLVDVRVVPLEQLVELVDR